MLAKDAVAYVASMPPDEPVFVLRAQDCLAPEMIEKWVIRARALNVNVDKMNDASSVAEEMLQWPTRKIPD